jgi:phage/plasmid primase-like uncharacterized protein
LCQHARVARGARRFQNGNDITRLKAPQGTPRSGYAVLILIFGVASAFRTPTDI